MNEYLKYISIDTDVRFGKPCITGTRITVENLLKWLANGMTYNEIVEDFPPIKEAHILTPLAFAANREPSIKIVAV